MFWDQLTSPEIGKLSKTTPVVLPISATEQHGPHLPLATDRLIGEHFCREINQNMAREVLILPSLVITCSEHHLDFPGTLSLDHAAFLAQMTLVLESAMSHGFRNFLVLNSHGGNQGIGQVMVERFGYRHPECKIVLATWWKLALEALKPMNESGTGGAGHAGEFETSLMLLIAPELVRRDKIEKGLNTASYDWAEGDMLTGPRASYYRSMQTMTPNGIFGDPTFASMAKGQAITEVVVPEIEQILIDMIK